MGYSFQTGAVPERENSFELLPDGWYTAQVSESAIEPLKSGKGECLKLVFEVLSDGFRNRKLFVRLNVKHESADAERIAQQDLKDLCVAVGLPNGFTNSFELHGRPVQVKVKIRAAREKVKGDPSRGAYDEQNEVTRYKALTVGAPGSNPTPTPRAPAVASPVAARVTAPAAEASKSATPPWMRK